MLKKVFAVRDIKAVMYLQPFYDVNSGAATRAFGDAVQDKNCPFNKHPEDFELFEIGTWDDSTGVLTSLSPAKVICSALDFRPVEVV